MLLPALAVLLLCAALGQDAESPDDGFCGLQPFQAGDCEPYSATSPFNVPLAEVAPDRGRSQAVASRLAGFGPGPQIAVGVAETSADFDHPIYFSRQGDPAYEISCAQECEGEGRTVRVPIPAEPAGGSDAHMAVIEERTGLEYDLYGVRDRAPGGGVLRVALAGVTTYSGPRADGLGSNATAAHFGLAAGIIRPGELAQGQIDHALAIVVECTNGRFVPPAEGPGVGRSCASIGQSPAGAPALGEHIYLEMSDEEIDGLEAAPWQQAILLAMARYGMYVEDTGATANGWALLVESGSSYTSFGRPDPWVRLARTLGVPRAEEARVPNTRILDLQGLVDWGARLRVAPPVLDD
ncbi:MAG: hypothetical protein ACR2G3_07525 [Solirubrobacterales bacterium]